MCQRENERNILGLFDNGDRTISGPASRHALQFKVLFGTQNAGHFVPDSTLLLKSHFEGRVKLRVPSPIPLAPEVNYGLKPTPSLNLCQISK